MSSWWLASISSLVRSSEVLSLFPRALAIDLLGKLFVVVTGLSWSRRSRVVETRYPLARALLTIEYTHWYFLCDYGLL